MTTAPAGTTAHPNLLSGPLRTLTVGAVSLVSLWAFEAMAVATAMPTVAAALDGLAGYALAFGLPMATSVLAMVASGVWSDAADRRHPCAPASRRSWRACWWPGWRRRCRCWSPAARCRVWAPAC